MALEGRELREALRNKRKQDVQWKLFNRVGYSPHPKQREFHESQARFKVAISGRRWGKSRAASADVLPDLFTTQLPGWVVGPTYDLASKEFRYLWDDICVKMKLGSQIKKKSFNARAGEMYIHMPWGARVECKSANHPDSLVGEGLGWVIIAEAAKIPREVWEKYIEPALADYKGRALLVTTPEGYNWVYDLHEAAKKRADWESFRYPSWGNPVVYPGGRTDPEILRLEEELGEVWFAQEIAAKFTTMSGRIFEDFSEEIHVVDDYQYQPAVPNYMTFDWGFSNPFVALDIQVTPSEKFYVWREYYKKRKTEQEHCDYLLSRDNPKGYRTSFGVGDPADPGAVQAVRNSGLCKMVTAPGINDIDMGLRKLKTLLNPKEPRLFIAKECEQLIWEMSTYQMKSPRITRPQNMDENPRPFADHGPSALRYLVMYLEKFGARTPLQSYYDEKTEIEYPSLRGTFTLTGQEP